MRMRSRRADDVSSGSEISNFDEFDEDRLRERVCADLAKLGVLGEESKRIAKAILGQLRQTGPDAYEDLFAGVRFSQQARLDVVVDLKSTQREFRQLERLMGGFATELRKLDEVLEVLAAYVRRMRSSTGDGGENRLH